jgi:predicted DNA-binding protein
MIGNKTPEKTMLCVRMPKTLWQRLARLAAAKGIDKTKLVINCLEKELDEYGGSEAVSERLQNLQQEIAKIAKISANNSGLPWEILEKILLSSAFCEALLQKLNLQQATGEWAKIVNQARSQAVAETNYLKEKLYGAEL